MSIPFKQNFTLSNAFERKSSLFLIGSQLLFLIFLYFLTACSVGKAPELSINGENFKIVWQTKPGQYQLVTKTLLGVQDLTTMSGHYSQFLIQPKRESQNLSGASPQFKFLKDSSGVFVAQNEISLAAATLYYHMQNMAQMDEILGAKTVNHWPRKVGLLVVNEKHSTDNALYEGSTDSILFFPYTYKDLALYVNAGVVAHEHFHSLFLKLSLMPSCSKGNLDCAKKYSHRSKIKDQDLSQDPATEFSFYHLALLSSLNEGLADYWGWMYTKDPNFISNSISNIESRSLDTKEKPENLQLSLLYFKNQILGLDETDENFKTKYFKSIYSYGTKIAQILKGFTEVYQHQRGLSLEEAQIDIGRSLLKAINEIPDSILSLSQTNSEKSEVVFFEHADFLQKLYQKIDSPKEGECLYIKNFIKTTSGEKKFECKK